MDEAYAVYSVGLAQLLKPDQDVPLVIATRLCKPFWYHFRGRAFEDLANRLERRFGIQIDSLADTDSIQLESRFTLDANVILLSDEARKEIVGVEGGHTAFFQKYGSLKRLSPVAFDKNHQYALFSFEEDHELVGTNQIVLLEKKEGQWNILTTSLPKLLSLLQDISK